MLNRCSLLPTNYISISCWGEKPTTPIYGKRPLIHVWEICEVTILRRNSKGVRKQNREGGSSQECERRQNALNIAALPLTLKGAGSRTEASECVLSQDKEVWLLLILCAYGQNGSHGLRMRLHSQVAAGWKQGTQNLGKDSTEMVWGTRKDLAEHWQYPLHIFRWPDWKKKKMWN